ncbi:MAG: hypothetical protein L0H96_10230 [Humibacillus sp.]|nr:hypothetical protein [Humibacillus sp.]MDN5777278.1 hypothetical protein [Humibacillus sp.]
MPTAVPYGAAPSAVLRVYLQQRRLDRLRSARRVARWLSVALVLVLVTMTVMRGTTLLADAAVAATLLLGLVAWLVAMVATYRVHSSRLDSRVSLARLDSVRRHLDTRDTGPRVERARVPEGRPGTDVLTEDHRLELHTQVRTLENEIDESERRVERALRVGAVSATLGAVALFAAVGATALSMY